MSEAMLVHDLSLAAADAAIESILIKAKMHHEPAIQDMILVCALATLAARHTVFMENTLMQPLIDAASSMFKHIYQQETERLVKLKHQGKHI